jgi:hypothetical protein
MTKRDLLLLLTLAVLFTALGSVKPMHIDETANYYYAVQIAKHPLDPYGFQMFWYERPEPANHVLTPPVMVYWWSVAVRLFGDHQPVVWKLWLLPFNLAFVFSLHALFRRFAPRLEMGLTWMTVLSPAILPSMNLMPDIPALSLSLAALALFLKAEEGGSYGLAALSGLVAGLAMEAKYTAFIMPAVLLLRAVLIGRLGLGVVACALAAAVFSGWEALIGWKYGESHFLYHLHESRPSAYQKLTLLAAFLPLLGGTAPLVGMLGLTALGARRWLVELTGAAVVAVCLILAYVGFTAEVTPGPWFEAVFGHDVMTFDLAAVLFGSLGLLVMVVGSRLVVACWPFGRDEWFLVLWLCAEVAGYFALSPFPAVRRMLAVVIVLTLLAGHVASRGLNATEAGTAEQRWALIRRVVACSIMLGLFFWGVDVIDAGAQKLAAERAAQEIADRAGRTHLIAQAVAPQGLVPSAVVAPAWPQLVVALKVATLDASALADRGGEGDVWYVGHWGFQYYAEQAGMKPVVPRSSRLKPGDWIVVPNDGIEQQAIKVAADRSQLVLVVQVEDALPLRTVVYFYGGDVPIDHQSGPRVEVEVRRITADWVPARPED